MYSKGINQENIQYMNRELVLRVLQKNEGCSRAELAKITHLRPATITNIINELQELNLVRESGVISEGKGRSAIRLVLNTNAFNVVGIRIARRYLIVGVFDIRGDELKSVRCEIESWMNSDDVLSRIIKYSHMAIDEWAQGEVVAIICDNDDMSSAAQKACNENGRSDVVCVGVDGNPNPLQMVKDGEMGATVLQDGPGQVAGAIEMIKTCLAGETPEKEIAIPFVLVTIDNVDEYLK